MYIRNYPNGCCHESWRQFCQDVDQLVKRGLWSTRLTAKSRDTLSLARALIGASLRVSAVNTFGVCPRLIQVPFPPGWIPMLPTAFHPALSPASMRSGSPPSAPGGGCSSCPHTQDRQPAGPPVEGRNASWIHTPLMLFSNMWIVWNKKYVLISSLF